MSEELNENLDSLNETTEEVENTDVIEELEQSESPENEKPKYTELERKLYIRARKAEAKLKELKELKAEPTPEIKPQPQQSQTTVSPEVATIEDLLRTSKGYDDEDLKQLRIIAAGAGVSLVKAQEDKLFQLHLSNRAEEKRKAQAKLGASKGSGKQTKKEMSELTRDEHMEVWKERMGVE